MTIYLEVQAADADPIAVVLLSVLSLLSRQDNEILAVCDTHPIHTRAGVWLCGAVHVSSLGVGSQRTRRGTFNTTIVKLTTHAAEQEAVN